MSYPQKTQAKKPEQAKSGVLEKVNSGPNIVSIDYYFDFHKKDILDVLPFADPSKKENIFLTIFNLTIKAYREIPQLRTCRKESILSSIIDAASVGLIPFSPEGDCYIIPYGDTAKFQFSYKGLIKLMRRSGLFKDIFAKSVREKDEFYYEYSSEGFFWKHTPSFEPAKDRNITHFYAGYFTAVGGKDIVVMHKLDIDEHRDRYAKSYRSHKDDPEAIWNKNYEEMGLKTVVIRLNRYAPKSAEFMQQICRDEIVKRELAPEPGDFTEEAEREFKTRRIIDATGTEIIETGSTDSGKPKINRQEVTDRIRDYVKELKLSSTDFTNLLKEICKTERMSQARDEELAEFADKLKVRVEKERSKQSTTQTENKDQSTTPENKEETKTTEAVQGKLT
jgi:recombination protein RecT